MPLLSGGGSRLGGGEGKKRGNFSLFLNKKEKENKGRPLDPQVKRPTRAFHPGKNLL